jgi:hypothetical protein
LDTIPDLQKDANKYRQNYKTKLVLFLTKKYPRQQVQKTPVGFQKIPAQVSPPSRTSSDAWRSRATIFEELSIQHIFYSKQHRQDSQDQSCRKAQEEQQTGQTEAEM